MWPRTWCSLSRHSWSRTLSLRNFRPTAPAVTSFPSGKPWCLSIKSNISRRVFLGHCPNTLPVINYDIFWIHSCRCIEFITEEPESLFSWIKLPFFLFQEPLVHCPKIRIHLAFKNLPAVFLLHQFHPISINFPNRPSTPRKNLAISSILTSPCVQM